MNSGGGGGGGGRSRVRSYRLLSKIRRYTKVAHPQVFDLDVFKAILERLALYGVECLATHITRSTAHRAPGLAARQRSTIRGEVSAHLRAARVTRDTHHGSALGGGGCTKQLQLAAQKARK